MQEQDYLYDEFETESANGGHIRRRKVTQGDFGHRPMRWRRWVIIALILLLLIVWPAWAGFYTDWLWFNELGYQSVFSTILTTQLLSALLGGFLAALLFWLSLQVALRVSGKAGHAGYKFYVGNQEIAVADAGNFIAKLAIPISLVVGAFFALKCWSEWDEFLLFRHGVSFGEKDPVFGFDISFYLFKLPFLDFVSGSFVTLLIFAMLAAIIVYLGRASLSVKMGDEHERASFSIQPGARGHLLALLAAWFVVIAYRYYLDLPSLLSGDSGAVAGASYTDIHANLPLLWAHIGASLLVALLALAGIFLAQMRLVILGLALFALVIVAGLVYPALLQRFSVAPNELQKESPYLAYSIAGTRKAYNLDAVEERDLTGASTLTAQDIQENQRTIHSIRLWDQEPLLDTFGQLQEYRPYYTFRSVDNDRYKINGEVQQVMLSVRELESENLPNRNWINERLIFTHGYGLTLGPVNQITPEGLPVLFVQGIPPTSTLPDLKIDRPEIYYGEMENAHAFVRTKQQEFNFPEGEKNQFTTYEGTGGVSIGSYFRKLLFSTRLGELKLMLSDDITAESRVLYHRNIEDRLKKVAPFLLFDRDPYLVISEGKCFWICDAYTTSNRYPYSSGVWLSAQTEINYIRNSVKAVVDAYNGSVQLYIADDRDPMIQTYARIFPGILKPLSEMPADLRAHLRYPEDIFRIQTRVYATYHMDQPEVFYNKEDQWEIASAAEKNGQATAMEPYYTIMKLPDAPGEEFLVMLPFVPKNKQNLAAWMVARSDGDHYGKLVVYRIPKQKQIFGPKQVLGRINSDTEISGQLTLWSQRGSKVIWGTMLLIPIKESLLYVQPLYLQGETSKIPELKRVIVGNESKVAMAETLEQSLNKLFGSSTAAPPPTGDTQAKAPQTPAPPQPSAPPGLAAQALQQYDRAEQALKEGNFAKYGEELKKLRATLEELNKQNK